MLSDTLLIEEGPGEIRCAVLAQSLVWDVAHFRVATPDRLGAVYRGRVVRVDPGTNAAFVDLGDGWTRQGFLRARDAGPKDGPGRIQQIVQEGATLIVQISGGNTVQSGHGDAEGPVKGPSVTAHVTRRSRSFDYRPNRRGVSLEGELDAGLRERLEDLLQTGEGLRLGAGVADDRAPDVLLPQIATELAAMRRDWNAIKSAAADRDGPGLVASAPDPIARFLNDHAHAGLALVLVGDPGSAKAARDWAEAHLPELSSRIEQSAAHETPFGVHEVDGELEASLCSRAEFGEGGYLLIEPGETLTAIDVNSGAAAGKAGRHGIDANLAAIPVIARQIRLRGLSGPIVVDFLKMTRAADRDRVADTMAQAMAHDTARCHVLGLSPLGHLELTRQRRGPSLAQRLAAPSPQPCLSARAACYQALRQLVAAATGKSAPVALRASDEIVKLLQGELAGARQDAERRLGRELILKTDPAMTGPSYDVSDS